MLKLLVLTFEATRIAFKGF